MVRFTLPLFVAIIAVSLIHASQGKSKEKSVMTERTATGRFEVKLAPQVDNTADVGRMTIDKSFHGDLVAKSVGQMIAVRTAIEGSAGYVAMERVTGTLDGKTGSFALQHSGSMNKGTPSLIVEVVPDSGTDGLAGISGKMSIIVEGGEHRYVFKYVVSD